MAMNEDSEWNEAQWSEWLDLRDRAMADYFQRLRLYVNLPASSRLIYRDLCKIIPQRILPLVYTTIAPPENRIFHPWNIENDPTMNGGEGDDWNGMGEADGTGMMDGMPALFTPMEKVPDDVPTLAALQQLTVLTEESNQLLEDLAVVFSMKKRNSNEVILLLGLLTSVSQGVLLIEHCRFSVCGRAFAKSYAILKHAKKRFQGALRIWKGEPLPESGTTPSLLAPLESDEYQTVQQQLKWLIEKIPNAIQAISVIAELEEYL